MIYTKMTRKALQIAFDAHKEQVDKSGLPYIFHPFHLAEQMKTEDEVIVALLHDVV
jgi:(p)ppGpp synthase/HD superfamily hydrolase